MIRVRSVLLLLAFAVALLGYLALAPWLDPLPRYGFPPAALLAAFCEVRGRRLLPLGPATALAIAAFAVYLPQFGRSNLAPVADILIILLALRLLSPKEPRHLLQIYALALFALAGSTLFELSPGFLLYLLLLLFAISVSLVLLTVHASAGNLFLARSQLKSLLGTGLLMPAAALPLAALLFVILPRTQFPLWSFLNQPGEASAGYTERVQPGAAAAVGAGGAVALRVETEELDPQELYWRGTVLNQIEGETWVRQTPPAQMEVPGAGRRVVQAVYPENNRQQVLFALDTPLGIAGVRTRESSDRVFSGRWRSGQRVSYQATSILGTRLVPRGAVERAFYLQVPAGEFPRLRQLAQDLFRDAASEPERLERLRAYFRGGGFRYSTTGLPTGPGALARFVLDERAGHCEFFASSFALLARMGGIPVRLVGGYYGGDYNALGGYYLVGERRAHVWVEILRTGGWERIDPAIYALNHEAALRPSPRNDWRLQLRMAGDALEHFWSVALLNFDFERQRNALRQTREGLRSFKLDARGGATLAATLLAAAGLFFALRAWRRRARRPAERLARPFLALARRRLGMRRLPSDLGLFDLARRMGDPDAERCAEILARAIYGEKKIEEKEEEELKSLFKKIEKR